MTTTLDEKYNIIKSIATNMKSRNPVEIAKEIMKNELINIHGPEHHYLDGVSFLVAYKNSGGKINLEEALEKLKERTIKMPGAMCGLWGVCGSVASIGACLSIINETGPLSDNQFYKDNMEYTSSIIRQMSIIGGPRCCKRNAFLSLKGAVSFVKEKYGVEMEIDTILCDFSDKNLQCIKNKCPFYRNNR